MDSSAQNFWQKLEQRARKLGFAEIGACLLKDISKEGELLEQWIQKGYSADMEYMKDTKEVRKDPQKFLPGAQSVVVGVVPYYKERQTPTNSPWKGESAEKNPLIPSCEGGQKGKIARYATGRDYHKVIKKMLRELTVFLEEYFPGTDGNDFRISLDAHPVLERVWAEKSGLGFVGKNACLITASSGSWILIGCVFTTQKIPLKKLTSPLLGGTEGGIGAKKHKNQKFSKLSCGNCTRCIDACPTGAIIASGSIDARKCISYLTIENKGPIPKNLRKSLGDRIFGCDICQEVCPFNIPRQKGIKSPLLEKEIAGTEVFISEILKIETDAEFATRFAGSPLMRAKRRGMIRNACIVAGNSGNVDLLPVLKKVRDREKDDMLKEHAQWAIEELEGASSRA